MSQLVNVSLARAGSLRKDERISGNLCTWVFSNPFALDGLVSQQEPSVAQGGHVLETIHRDTPLMVDDAAGISFTWKHVYRMSLSLAAGILRQPLRHGTAPTRPSEPSIGPVVLLCLPNCAQFAIAFFGVIRAGYTVTMANTGLTATELATMIGQSGAQLVITVPENSSKVREASIEANGTSIPIYTISIDSSNLSRTPKADGEDSWRQLMEEPLAEPVRMNYAKASQHAAAILWSSGTSGRPKGIVMTHQAFIASLISLWHVTPTFSAGEHWIGVVPFYHIFGLVNILLLAPCCGATIFTLQKFEPQLFLTAIPRHGITCLHMAPPLALLLAKNATLKAPDFASVRNALCGGAPVAWEIIDAVHTRLGVQIRLGYGLSEAGSVCNQVVLSGDISDHQGHTGIPLYGVELKIVDTKNVEIIMPVGEIGRIFVRSGGMMKGYLNDPAKTKEALKDNGWFDTGDLGTIDAKGRLQITGRLKDVIKVRGFQVSPVELEELILALPSVADVAVAAVYDEERATELPRAYVVPAVLGLQNDISAGRQDVAGLRKLSQEIRTCVEKGTVHYKWLKGNVMFVNVIPKSPAGKISRKDLDSTAGVLYDIYQTGSRKRMTKI